MIMNVRRKSLDSGGVAIIYYKLSIQQMSKSEFNIVLTRLFPGVINSNLSAEIYHTVWRTSGIWLLDQIKSNILTTSLIRFVLEWLREFVLWPSEWKN